jgi:hypothetical protein
VADRLECLTADCGRPALPPVRAARSYAGLDLAAKDFDSFLRAMLDQLPRLAPDWVDRGEADPGMVLLELFAYAGDQLSYLQDRVALEGYLRTATQTESVRRLLSLIDYTLDPGAAAETELVFECVGASPLLLPAGFAVSTPAVKGADPVIYETVADAVLYPALSTIALAVDAPSSPDGMQAVLAANLSSDLQAGMWLSFEQGDRREWARVASATFAAATTTITLEQALAGRYAAAADPISGAPAAVVHGNRVHATHGATEREAFRGTGEPSQTCSLELAPITWVVDADTRTPISTLSVTVDGETWVEVDDFVDSDATSLHYRVARSNDGYVTVHFGDGASGAVPPAGSRIAIRYRVGIGSAGHAAKDTLTVFDARVTFAGAGQKVTRARNPFAATPGRDPQPLSQAKLLGPAQLREQNRAVVPADFEDVLARGVLVGGALVAPLQSRAHVRHTGSWNTAVVSVDMPDRRPLAATPGLREAFEDALHAKKMAGMDVRVEDAHYAALHISLVLDVKAEHFARDVRQAVEQALTGPLAGAVPFFGAGRFRFGQSVFLSDLYAVVTSVPGVRAVTVMRFKRLGDRYPDATSPGVIAVGSLEVARCDNDPSAPELGVLSIRTCGGKEG